MAARAQASFWSDPRVRGVVTQAALVLVVGAVFWAGGRNALLNMRARGIPVDFGFWSNPAGFEINQRLVPYSALSTYGEAFVVGLVNTLLVAAIGLVLATLLGFAIGVARLSQNWIVARLATIYVEAIRNVPLLLQLLFWYNAVLKPLPQPRQSLALPGGVFLNNRGFMLPEPHAAPGFLLVVGALVVGILATLAAWVFSRRMIAQTGRGAPMGLLAIGFLIGLPLLAFALTGAPLSFTPPVLKGFNFAGGVPIYPELVALLLGLTLYTAAFIAEIVRAGVASVLRGQSEAARALGLHSGQTMKLVVIPQALRVIIPPLTSQYLNLIKNSSLAVFIGYPDLVQVFMGTVLNQTGAAVQVVLITMAVYLAISLVISAAMNVYNARVALVER